MATGGSKLGIKCCICAEQGRIIDAEKCCVSCNQYYCTSCADVHSLFAASRGHQLLVKSNTALGWDWDESLRTFRTERCSVHRDNMFFMICPEHEEIVCAVCVAINHQSCKNSSEVPVQDLPQVTIIPPDEGMKDTKQDAEGRLEVLRKYLEKAVETVKTLRQEVERLPGEIKEETIKIFKNEFDETNEIIKTDLESASAVIRMIDESTAKSRMSEGHVSADQPSGVYKIKSQKEVDIKENSDTKTCCIYCSCITEDGFLLLTDFSNEKLKRVDLSTGQVKDNLALNGSPFAVCLTSKTEAAVTLPDKESVEIVSLLDKLTIIRTLKLDHRCLGMSYVNDKLIISDQGSCIYIHDMNGHQLQKIAQGNLFTSTHHIAVTDAGDRVYVADTFNGLVVLDTQGNPLTTVPVSCYGVCTHERNVFVCGYISSNIVQIGENYEVLGEIAMIRNPQSLSFDRQNARLIVVTNYSNTIKVIELV